MLTLNTFRKDFIATITSPRGRRLYRTWALTHPVLTTYDSAPAALHAAENHAADGNDILNALLTLAGSEPLARQAIAVCFEPWIGTHLSRHGAPAGEREDHIAVLITSFLEAAVQLSPTAPHLWPATTIIQAARNPIDRYYRYLDRVPAPAGHTDDLEELGRIELVHPTRPDATGAELVVAGLIAELEADRITLEDANLVARMVGDGRSAREQAGSLYLSPRGAQHRVQKIARRLAEAA